MSDKNTRMRRALRSRSRIKTLAVHRLCIHRTPRHIYAQLILPGGSTVLVTASTLQKEIRSQISGGTGNVDAARAVGRAIAEKAKDAGVEAVAFDRSGFKYHGRVKALADAAREHGLKF